LLLIKFELEIMRDLLGLSGAILTALAFFRLERRKREAETLKIAIAPQPRFSRRLQIASRILEEKGVLGSNDIDAQLTFWGLILISWSFLISIALTIGQHFEFFGKAG
jgi:hypothetical protein